MTKPRPYRVFIVVDQKPGSNNKTTLWHDVGIAWPHKNGFGFNGKLHPGISINGDFVIAAPRAVGRKVKAPDGEAWYMLR